MERREYDTQGYLTVYDEQGYRTEYDEQGNEKYLDEDWTKCGLEPSDWIER